ncbi:MAG: hypothetical protein ACEPOZ_10795 [Marinifilaceae bacterium]
MAKSRNKKRKKGKKATVGAGDGAARRVFFNRFYKLLKMTGCSEAFRLLTQKEKGNIYEGRVHLMQPKADSSENLPPDVLKFFIRYCTINRTVEDIVFVPGQERISFLDLLTVDAFKEYVEGISNAERKKELETGFAGLLAAFEEFGDPFAPLCRYYNKLLAYGNWCFRTMYGFVAGIKCRNESVLGIYHYIHIKSFEPRVSMVNIGGKKRPVFQIGWPWLNEGVDWVFLETSRLGTLYKGKKKKLPICIQTHAVNRFLGRNRPVPFNVCNYAMMLCFMNEESFLIYNNRLLFEFYLNGVKTGYFLGDLIGNKVIIRTFLFITNHDTPEGNKLEELSGLTKEDISFWNIDWLKPFMDNRLEEDHKLRKLFEEVGISDLFTLKDKLNLDKLSKTFKWEALQDYIQKGQLQIAEAMEEDHVI